MKPPGAPAPPSDAWLDDDAEARAEADADPWRREDARPIAITTAPAREDATAPPASAAATDAASPPADATAPPARDDADAPLAAGTPLRRWLTEAALARAARARPPPATATPPAGADAAARSEPDLRLTIPLDHPLDLVASLGLLRMGRLDPTQRLAPGHYWKATRTPAGPATLHLAHTRKTHVDAELWGPGAEWLAPRLAGLVGAHDRPRDFVAPPGLLHQLHRDHPGLRFIRAPWPWEVLLQVILQQRVTSTEAFGSFGRLARFHSERAPGPLPLRLPIAPRVLAYLPREELVRAGIDAQRIQCLLNAAAVARRVDELIDAPSDAIRERLRRIRGVGPWTVETTMIFAFGDPDAVPTGDYHLPNTVAWALASEPRADDARMLELLEPYRGQRARVIALIEAAGLHAPRYGPRMRLPGPR